MCLTLPTDNMKGHVGMFDLRYLKADKGGTTKPALSFYPFSFPCPFPTFDVNPQLGLLAASESAPQLTAFHFFA